ncbi:MAG TPA: lytic murein transglycosylase [Candidatus Binatia bacterium]|jgi:membrane-bound lytic murein transglycosylase B|nr:lytic murein transglycosylase [Candidatus Binatia bacterium]
MRTLLVLGLLLLSLTAVRAQEFDDKGYGWLIDKLEVDGVPRERSLRVFSDPRFPPFDGLGFSLDPRESHAMYSGHLSASSTARARRCMDDHLTAFRAAEQAHGVSAAVIAAIVHVESACNRNTGNTIILPRLARLAMANEPPNLDANIARYTDGVGSESSADIARRVRARGQRLEDMFYPEVLGTFTIAARLGIDPLSIRGSGSGAFGMPQFLPTSYLRHGEDGNGDGVVSLYDPDDAIFSCAKYLSAHGWKPGITYEEQRRVIWDYNHSDAYIDAVLGLASRIADPDEPVVEAAAPPRPRKKVAARKATSKKRVVAKKAPAKKSAAKVKKTSVTKKAPTKTTSKKTATAAR